MPLLEAINQLSRRIEGGFRVGIASDKEVAAALRKIADQVETGTVLIQKAEHITVIDPDEFLKHVLAIEYTTREKQ